MLKLSKYVLKTFCAVLKVLDRGNDLGKQEYAFLRQNSMSKIPCKERVKELNNSTTHFKLSQNLNSTVRSSYSRLPAKNSQTNQNWQS